MKCNRNTPLALERHALEREIGELRRQVRQLRFEQDVLMAEDVDLHFGVLRTNAGPKKSADCRPSSVDTHPLMAH
jgi:hypothetical protein